MEGTIGGVHIPFYEHESLLCDVTHGNKEENKVTDNIVPMRNGKRKAALQAIHKIKKIRKWEDASENSKMFKNVARALDAEFERERMRRGSRCLTEQRDICDNKTDETNEEDDDNSSIENETNGVGEDEVSGSDDDSDSVDESGESEAVETDGSEYETSDSDEYNDESSEVINP